MCLNNSRIMTYSNEGSKSPKLKDPGKLQSEHYKPLQALPVVARQMELKTSRNAFSLENIGFLFPSKISFRTGRTVEYHLAKNNH